MSLLKQLSGYIPEESVAVRRLFDRVTATETERRKLQAVKAIFVSAVNVGVYMAVDVVIMPVVSLVGRVISLNNWQIPFSVRDGASKAVGSLYFSAVLAKAIGLNMWSAKAYPLEFVIPAEIATSAWLQSDVSEGFEKIGGRAGEVMVDEYEVKGYPFKLYKPLKKSWSTADRAFYDFSGYKNLEIDGLIGLLEREDLNLTVVNTPGGKAYLLEKNDPLIQSLARDGHIAVYARPTVCRYPEAPAEPIVETKEESLDFSASKDLSSSSVQNPPPPLPQDFVHSVILRAELLGSKLISRKPPEPAEHEPAAEPISWTERLGGVCLTYFTGGTHPIKEKKYGIIAAQLMECIQQADMQQQFGQIVKQGFTALKEKCLQIAMIGSNPGKYSDQRAQYRALVSELQKGVARVPEKDDTCRDWMGRVCYHRFAEVKLFNYCKDLVENASGYLSNNLALDTFWGAFQIRRKRVDAACTKATGLSAFDRALQKAKGHFNIYFNPLAGSNVPYIYAYMQQAGSNLIKILRHGVPITQSNPLGLGTWFGWTGFVTPAAPVVTADYIAFIEEAKERDENILHLIFENGTTKTVGDESARVEERLDLGEKHSNFFPLALRMDGDFFKGDQYIAFNGVWHGPTHSAFRRELLQTVLGKFEETGFCFPEKIRTVMREKSGSVNQYVGSAINTVEAIYFPDQSIGLTQERYQAFILLTYVHLTHALCKDLDISILEALCKDDKDRGGAFKAILTLDFLYRSNQLTPAKLDELMVNLIAAPLIITKDAMLEDRADLIKYVLDVMLIAPEHKKLADEHKIEGQFNVAKELYQVVLP